MTLYRISNIETPGEITNEQLRIKILTTEAISFLFPDFKSAYLIKDLENFILPGISEADILNKHVSQLKLNLIQSEFIFKLKQLKKECESVKVLKNGRGMSNEFIWFLLQKSGLDQGNELSLKPSHLTFVFKLTFYYAFADIEANRGKSILWILNNPHPNQLPDKNDSNHIATSMIAAMQLNRRNLQKAFPERIIGISVIDDRFTFYSTQISMEYLNELFRGNINQNLNIYQYPSKNGLSISNEIERFEILKILSNLKTYSLSMPIFNGRNSTQL